MKEFFEIVKRNFLQPAVIAIFVLACSLLLLGERRDAWFISSVIMLNTLISIVQEVRARRALKKLELMNSPRARRIMPDGSKEEIMFDQIAIGDKMQIQAGDEIPADGFVIESAGLEVDESMLTGESAAIDKNTKDKVYASTIATAGSAIVEASEVGAGTRAGAITSVLKRYMPAPTPLQKAITRAIYIFTYSALAVAGLIFLVYWTDGQSAIKIVKTITSAAVTVVPEGLLLASTLLLALGSLRLAQVKVLPQKISAIEAMALLNVLCVDKTGTLTSDQVVYDKLEIFNKKDDKKNIEQLIALVALATPQNNSTSQAIMSALKIIDKYKVIDTLAFSSDRKMSGVRVKIKQKIYTVLLGAPEYLGKLAPMDQAQIERVQHLVTNGQRVLLVALFKDNVVDLKKLSINTGRPVGLVVLNNGLRDNVKQTVDYLQRGGVSIKVISGDNPMTVQYVARQAGIKYSNKITTGGELDELSPERWQKVVKEMTIFARILPEQKERLIETFISQGNFTGMVGDGVNDALALKKANLGVAMQAGAAASRRVSDVVLLDNSFTSLPIGMKLGNRIMLAIETIALLFFHKVFFGVILLITTMVLNIVYPFEPRHVSFINIFLVTIPTVLTMLFLPHSDRRVDPRYFWHDTLVAALPIALITGLAIAASYWTAYNTLGPGLDASTATVVVTVLFGAHIYFLSPFILGSKSDRKTLLTAFLYVAAAMFVILMSFGFDISRRFFDFGQLSLVQLQALLPVALIVLIAFVLQRVLAIVLRQKFLRRSH